MKQIIYIDDTERKWKEGFYIGGVVYSAKNGKAVDSNILAKKEVPWTDVSANIKENICCKEINQLAEVNDYDPKSDQIEYKTSVHKGEVIANVSVDPEYPGIEVSLNRGDLRFSPRVVLEYPYYEDNARVLVFNDPEFQDDYTFKIDLKCPAVKDIYEIYLAEDENIIFKDYETLIEKSIDIDRTKYKFAYQGALNKMSLDDIYTMFNINHPKDYRNRSLSVGDVIILVENNKETTYIVDSVGFREINGF